MITVRRGDTLSAIAERELGAASRWTEIFHANSAQLGDPDELAVGMRLVAAAVKEVGSRRTFRKSMISIAEQPSCREASATDIAGRAVGLPHVNPRLCHPACGSRRQRPTSTVHRRLTLRRYPWPVLAAC